MTARTKLIVANWKMNGTQAAIAPFVATLQAQTLPDAANIVVCPPFTLLAAFAGSGLALGGQDCHASAKGAYTGCISADMLRDSGCNYVIIGHSERRRDFAESNELLAAKVQAALAAGMVPIFCIGEKAGEAAEAILSDQLQALKGLPLEQIVIAYEPVWAIGTGQVAAPADIIVRHAFIRGQVPQIGQILYGGSVTADNAGAILALDGVDGVLVGGASLDAASFAAIAQSVANPA